MKQTIGILFIRWNLYNRVAIAIAYFENSNLVFMHVDKGIMKKLCDNFLSENLPYDFISHLPFSLKKNKANEAIWNQQAIHQNGFIEIQKTKPIAIRLNKRTFNKYVKIFINSH